MSVLVGLDLLHKLCVHLTLLPSLGKLCGGTWNFLLEAVSDRSLGWVGERGQEVRGGLTIGAVVAHLRKVGLGLVNESEEDLPAFV